MVTVAKMKYGKFRSTLLPYLNHNIIIKSSIHHNSYELQLIYNCSLTTSPHQLYQNSIVVIVHSRLKLKMDIYLCISFKRYVYEVK